jgi:uncharacterized protein YndB with AHSA1/START domain
MTPMTETNNAHFTMTRMLDAPRALVWRAWTDPALLARWFGPKGTTTTVLAHDPRPGGITHLRMDMSGGGAIWARFVHREVAEPSRLSWVHSFADERGDLARAPFFDGVWPLELLNSVVFEEDGDRTRMTLTSETIGATAEECRIFIEQIPSMNQGWGGSFEQLDAVLASQPA